MFRPDEREAIKYGAMTEWGKRRSDRIVGMILLWRSLPYLAGAAVLGAVGYAGHLGWQWLTESLPKAESPGEAIGIVPGIVWLVIAVGGLGLAWVIAPGRYLLPSARFLRAFAVTLAIAALIGIHLGTR